MPRACATGSREEGGTPRPPDFSPGRRRYANRRSRPGQAGPARCGMSRLKAGARRIGAMDVHTQLVGLYRRRGENGAASHTDPLVPWICCGPRPTGERLVALLPPAQAGLVCVCRPEPSTTTDAGNPAKARRTTRTGKPRARTRANPSSPSSEPCRHTRCVRLMGMGRSAAKGLPVRAGAEPIDQGTVVNVQRLHVVGGIRVRSTLGPRQGTVRPTVKTDWDFYRRPCARRVVSQRRKSRKKVL